MRVYNKGQFKFNNKKSFDYFGLNILSVTINLPSINEYKASVPYCNGEYDFSSLYGVNTYSNRSIIIVAEIADKTLTRTHLNTLFEPILKWLFCGEARLDIDFEYGYFLGKVINVSSTEIFNYTGRIEIEFSCYPYRKFDFNQGEILWDNFCFPTDYLIKTKYNVDGVKEINLYNTGSTKVTPVIITNSRFEIDYKDTIYNLEPGKYEDNIFVLEPNDNKMFLRGKGQIEFIYSKEVL